MHTTDEAAETCAPSGFSILAHIRDLATSSSSVPVAIFGLLEKMQRAL